MTFDLSKKKKKRKDAGLVSIWRNLNLLPGELESLMADQQVVLLLTRHRTCDLGLEGAAADVVGPPVLDADLVRSRRHGGVEDLVALRNLLAVHLHLGRTLDGHGQRARTRLGVVDDEL